ncbi:MAG: DUF6080 domain-containing protein [Chloroflexota bacterium]
MRRSLLAASFLPAILFPLAAFVIGLRNPSLLDLAIISKALPALLSVFLLLLCLAIRSFLGKSDWASENLPGLILLFLFSLGYFFLASLLNQPDLNTNNIYFAADSGSWYLRMGALEGWNTGVRAVHPLAHLIFRPIVALISILTYGDRFTASLLLLAFAGSGCVFLTWKVAKRICKNEVHAVLFASLLGASASHLIFGSVIESYIFSAFLLLLFLWMLISNRSTPLLVAASVLTLGVTITNIAQQAATALFVQRNLRRVVLLFLMVVFIGAGLNVISRLIYPVTEYFFLPQNLTGEQRFAEQINLKRIGLMTENLLIYSVTAPQPYSSARNDMPRFNFLNGTIRDYIWFGWPSLLLWTSFLILAFVSFFKRLKAGTLENQLSLALLACPAFNFLLHVGYGTEPFLYSADWTYALVLFVAVSLKDYAERTWLQIGLFGLVMAVLVNNCWLMYLVARTVSPFLG